MPDVSVMDLADGRELAWIEYGIREGPPVLAFHGSPGTCHHFAGLAEVAARKDVRLIAPDRPGYGHSTYHAARSYDSWTQDVAQLAEHLGIEGFGVVGHSSGGPNAAACGRFLADRLVGCAVVSGPAPPGANVAKDQMLRSNRLAQRLAPVAPRLSGVVFEAGLRRGQRAPDRAMAWMDRILPPCDVAVIQRPEVRAALRAELARPLAATAGRAAVQDLQLELKPWGFALEEIEIAIHIWHGDADRNVPFANGLYQASAIPNATLHPVPEEGHWIHYTHFDEILDCLAA